MQPIFLLKAISILMPFSPFASVSPGHSRRLLSSCRNWSVKFCSEVFHDWKIGINGDLWIWLIKAIYIRFSYLWQFLSPLWTLIRCLEFHDMQSVENICSSPAKLHEKKKREILSTFSTTVFSCIIQMEKLYVAWFTIGLH